MPNDASHRILAREFSTLAGLAHLVSIQDKAVSTRQTVPGIGWLSLERGIQVILCAGFGFELENFNPRADRHKIVLLHLGAWNPTQRLP